MIDMMKEGLKEFAGIVYRAKVIATIQGRANQSCITWSGITIKKLPHHTTCTFTIKSNCSA